MESIIIVLTALTLGLTEVVKRLNIVNERFYPLVSLTIGILLALSQGMYGLEGIIVGLSASGLYSGVKRTLE